MSYPERFKLELIRIFQKLYKTLKFVQQYMAKIRLKMILLMKNYLQRLKSLLLLGKLSKPLQILKQYIKLVREFKISVNLTIRLNHPISGVFEKFQNRINCII